MEIYTGRTHWKSFYSLQLYFPGTSNSTRGIDQAEAIKDENRAFSIAQCNKILLAHSS